MNQREDSCVRAKAKRKRKHNHAGKHRSPAQPAQRIAHIAPNRFQPHGATPLPAVFLHLLHAAKLDSCKPPSLTLGNA